MEEPTLQNQQEEPNSQSSPMPIKITSSDSNNKMTKFVKLSLISLIILIVIIGGYFAYITLFAKPIIKSYEECIKAKGSIIQLSYPSMCVTKTGLRFPETAIPPTPPSEPASAIKSYEECIAADGSVVTTSYPQVCITVDGLRFTQGNDTVTPASKIAEECYTIVKKANEEQCPTGVECMRVDPESLFCVCIGGTVKVKSDTTGLQYSACQINGEDYKGKTFLDFEKGSY
jgi:putative hemolysin